MATVRRLLDGRAYVSPGAYQRKYDTANGLEHYSIIENRNTNRKIGDLISKSLKPSYQ